MAILDNRNPRPQYEHIDAVHEAIHEGGMYVISKSFLSVANDGYARVRIVPPAGTSAHTRLSVSVEGKTYIKTYTGTTYSNDGTAITPFNRLIGGSASTLLAYHTPTVNVLGTQRGDDIVGGGVGWNSFGANFNPEFESIVPASTDFMIELHNKAGTAKDMNIVINYYLRKV